LESTILTPSATLAYLGLFAVLTTGAWLLRRPRLRGTTLVVPWRFALGATLLVIGLEAAFVAGWSVPGAWVAPLRFMAASALFCPAMALLGAKRPQDRAWWLIVRSLWGILALPAAELMVVGRGDDLAMSGVRAWFLWALIGLEACHRLGTRLWLAGILRAAAQMLLFAPYLPLLRWEPSDELRLVALALATAAVVRAAVPLARRADASAYTRMWLDFRDQFGLHWSLRVADRVNAAAAQYAWPLRLTWRGFARTDGEPWNDATAPAELRHTFDGLLRRFVS